MSEIKTVLNFFDKNNGLAGVIKDLKEVKKLQAEINKQKGSIGSDNLKERTTALKEITRLQKQLDAQRKKSVKTGKEAVGVEKELVRVQEKDRAVKAKLKVARSEKFRQLQESNLALQKQNRLVKAEVAENSKLSSVYDRQSAKLNRLRKELKNLILTEGKGSAATRRLGNEVRKLDSKLKNADAAAGQFQRNVGNYPRGLGKATAALRNFAGALGITAGIAGLVRGVGEAIKVFKDFEKANSNLKAVLGGTDEEMKALSESSKLLGSTTAFTASEVTELNIALAKLGFPTEDILQMNGAILNGAAAMGSELGETATLVGATLRSFGLDASETGRVVDVLSKSTSASALDFAKLNASMSTIAPVANKFGFSLEGTTALLGQLSNAGFDASSAATATRNILLNLADSNGKLAKSLKEPVKDLPSLVRGLEQLKSEGVDLGAALELTDKRSVAAFATFLGGTDDVLALNDALEKSVGTAQDMADTQLDNLTGDITKLGSAWEGFILGVEDGEGSFNRVLRESVQGLIRLIGFFSAYIDELVLFGSSMKSEFVPIFNLFGDIIKTVSSLFSDGKEPINGFRTALGFLSTTLKISLIPIRLLVNTINILIAGFGLLLNTGKKVANFFGADFELDPNANLENFTNKLTKGISVITSTFSLFSEEQNKATASTNEFAIAQNKANKATRARLVTLKRTGEIFKKLIKDQNTDLRDFSDAELEAAKQEAINRISREKDLKVRQVGIDILNRLKDEQIRREKEANELLGDESKAINDLIEIQKALLKLAKEKDGSTESNIASRNKEIDVINEEISRLQALGTEKESQRKTDAEIDRQRKRLKILDDIEIRAIEDATEKKKALRSQSFEEKIDQLERNGLITAEIEKALTQELQDDLTQIEVDAELERQAKLKSMHDKLMAELEKQAKEEIALDKKTKAEEAKLAKEAAAAKKEAQQEVITQSKEAVDATIDELTRESQARIDSLGRQINAEQSFLDNNENLSAREIEFRRKKQAELEAERIEEQARLEKLAKTQAFFDLVAAFASSGDGQGAVGKAATTMAAAEVISGGFHDGGYTGDGNEYKEAGVVHKGEFVNTKKQTSEYGMKGWTAKDFDGAVKDGYFNQFTDSNMFADQNAKFLSVQNNKVGYDFARLENEMKSVKDAIGNIQSSDFAIQDGYFIKTKRSKGNTLITKKKLG